MKYTKNIIGRLDGDKFIIFVQDYKGEEKLSDRLYRSLENKRFIVDSQLDRIKLSFSIGQSHALSKMPIAIEKLLRNSDIDMHCNKYKNLSIIESPLKLNPCLFSKEIYQVITALSEKDMYTYIHSQYTAQYSVVLAEKLFLPDSIIKKIYLGAILHDIGKILISNDILRKPDKLTDDEFKTIKKHVDYGANIIRIFNLTDVTKNMILYHHERWDGKGYPNGILGKNTPIEGRIIQIADAFSAMTIKRVYRERMSLDNALEEI